MKKTISLWSLIPFLLFFVVFTTSCQNVKEDVNKEVIEKLKTNLSADADFLQMTKNDKDFRQKSVYDYYNMSGINKAFMSANEDKITDDNKPLCIQIYATAGIHHADEYVEYLFESIRLRRVLFDRYPILRQDLHLMVDVFRELSEKPKFDFSKVKKD